LSVIYFQRTFKNPKNVTKIHESSKRIFYTLFENNLSWCLKPRRLEQPCLRRDWRNEWMTPRVYQMTLIGSGNSI